MKQKKNINIIVGTNNAGKLREIKDLLPKNLIIYSPKELKLKSPKENGKSFKENSLIKAREATKLTGLVSLADDSGLCVDILKGAPGIYSADWAIMADGSRDFDMAMAKLIKEIQRSDSHKPYTANFVCSLILYWPDGHFEKFEGNIEGEIVWPGKGGNGHGYDPVFLPYGYKETFGQMDRWDKNKISHRGLAMENLLATCF